MPTKILKFTKTNFVLGSIIVLAIFLRSYKLSSLPSLNPDEAALGYNTYSLLQTGKDEHGASYPLHLKSFGDYKPGGYVYLAMPFIQVLGLTPFAVRLPNLIFSILAIIFLYKLVFLLASDRRLAVISTMILTISPWHIHFSRGAWETSISLSLIIIGIYFFYKYILSPKRITFYLLLFTLFFSLSLYFYHSARVIAPAIALTLFLTNYRSLITDYKKTIVIVFFGIILSTPVAVSFLRSGGSARFGGVGITADQGPIWRANELLNHHGNTLLTNRIIHNKRLLYAISWAEKYSSHFDLNFLFVNGDEVPRSKSPEMGQLHIIEFPLLVLGILFILRSKFTNLKSLIILLTIASPLASSLTFQAPSALRALPLVVPIDILIAMGIYQILNFIQTIVKRRSSVLFCFFIIFFIYAFSFVYYFDAYFNHAQKRYPFAWNYGFYPISQLISLNHDRFDQVYLTDKYDQPYILYLFFTKYPPRDIQKQITLSPPDKFGFSTVRQIDNIHFEAIDWQNIPTKSMVISADEKVPALPVQTLFFPNGQPGFKIYIK